MLGFTSQVFIVGTNTEFADLDGRFHWFNIVEHLKRRLTIGSCKETGLPAESKFVRRGALGG